MIKLSNLTRKEALSLFETDGEWMWGMYQRIKPISQSYYEENKSVDMKMSDLCGNLKKEMIHKYGKQLFCYLTWYRSWNWFLDYDGLLIGVNTSIRGTDYRIYDFKHIPKKELVKKIKSFVEEFYREII
jgi:hypothetical protein